MASWRQLARQRHAATEKMQQRKRGLNVVTASAGLLRKWR
jgi:hypothetical protein